MQVDFKKEELSLFVFLEESVMSLRLAMKIVQLFVVPIFNLRFSLCPFISMIRLSNVEKTE